MKSRRAREVKADTRSDGSQQLGGMGIVRLVSNLRSRITYANVGVTVALVFAMSSGAYAAKRILITSTKQISPKVLKTLRGKTGPEGPTGPAGPAGSAGKDGLAGKDGNPGVNGTGGAPGQTGPPGATGATGAAGAKGATGPAGVNGATGPQGPSGQSGFTETLPSGKTETGSWSFSTSNEELIVTTISFSIPLAKALSETAVHYVGPADSVTACKGTAAAPTASPGNLCVYQGAVTESVKLQASSETAVAQIFTPGASLIKLVFGEARGAGTSGAGLQFEPSEPGGHLGWGTWAVTAE